MCLKSFNTAKTQNFKVQKQNWDNLSKIKFHLKKNQEEKKMTLLLFHHTKCDAMTCFEPPNPPRLFSTDLSSPPPSTQI